jgi:hypothetical protein
MSERTNLEIAAIAESAEYLADSNRCHFTGEDDFGGACAEIQRAFVAGAEWAALRSPATRADRDDDIFEPHHELEQGLQPRTPAASEAHAIAEALLEMRSSPDPDYEHDVWSCKVGETTRATLEENYGGGADSPMRGAVARAFFELTGKQPDFIFSGWGRRLTEGERAVVENREPEYDKTDFATLTKAAALIERLVAAEPDEANG